jgi:hypothetical protein
MIDVFRLGVSIGMTNNVSQVLGVIQRDLFGLGRSVDALNGKFSTLKTAVVGAMAALTGGAALKGIGALIGAGDKLVQVQRQLIASGVSAPDVQAMTAKAYSIAVSTPGIDPAAALNLQGQLRSIFGSPQEAMATASQAAQTVTGLLQSGMSQDQVEALLKYVDLTGGANKGGQFDPETFVQHFQQVAQLVLGSNGLLKPQTLLQIGKTGGPFLQGGDWTAQLKDMYAAMLELGPAAGVAISNWGMQFLGGRTSLRSATNLEDQGLLDPKAITKDHGQYKINPSGLYAYQDLSSKGTVYWIIHDLIPKLRAKGENDNQLIQVIASIIGDQRGARGIIDLATDAGSTQQQRDAEVARQAISGPSAYSQIQETLAGQMKNFTAAWDGLMTALGAPAVPLAVSILKTITSGVLDLEAAAKSHPNAARDIVAIAGGLSVLAVALGTAAIIGASISAIAGGLTALGGAVSAGGALMLALGGPAGWIILGLTATGVAAYKLVQYLGGLPAVIHDVQSAFATLFGWIEKAIGFLTGSVGKAIGFLTGSVGKEIGFITGSVGKEIGFITGSQPAAPANPVKAITPPASPLLPVNVTNIPAPITVNPLLPAHNPAQPKVPPPPSVTIIPPGQAAPAATRQANPIVPPPAANSDKHADRGTETDPVHVILRNPQALAMAMRTGLAALLSSEQAGTSGFNGRATPFGTGAFAGVGVG